MPPPPPQQPGYPGGGMPPPPGGAYQAYNPNAGAKMIPELGLYQDEPWKRIVARIIDGIIAGLIPGAILAAILLRTTLSNCSINDVGVLNSCGPGAADYFLYGLISLVISGAYYIGFTAALGSTPGKMVFGLKVVTTTGQAPDLTVAAKRWAIDGAGGVLALLPFGAGRLLADLVLLAAAIWSVVLLFQDPKQQDLYDKVGGTYIVKK
jgi:uncharacterized RDD family membrane protein YckC